METDGPRAALDEQLREMERGQAAPWVSYPPMGWWWPLAFGVWAATYTLTCGLSDGGTRSALQLLHVLVMLAAIWWMRRLRGTYPSGRAPRELRGPFVLLFGGGLLVALVVWGLYSRLDSRLGPWPATAVALVLTWGLVAAYERSYARAAARVRKRLG